MAQFTQTILYTDTDGRARFSERVMDLNAGTPASRLSEVMPSAGYQLRHSPVGFRSQFHCTEKPQWVFILAGQMEIGLQGGVSRIFKPGEHFYSADVLRSVCHSVPMLEWLLSCGGCATEDFDEVLRFPAKLINLKWIAQHTDLSLFKKYGMEQIWRDAQQSQLLLKTLVLVAAGRRNKVRQPSPELWEHIVREYC